MCAITCTHINICAKCVEIALQLCCDCVANCAATALRLWYHLAAIALQLRCNCAAPALLI